MNERDAESVALIRGAAELGVELSEQNSSALLDYLDLLYLWNDSAGLTAVARADAVRLHLLDSIAVAPLLERGASLADLGSGGGLPGFVLACVRPDLRVALVEPKRKRCSFLATAVGSLKVVNVEICESRAEAFADARAGLFDAVCSRAFRSPAAFVSAALPLVKPGGCILIMASGRSATYVPDTDELDPELPAVTFVLPGGKEHRQVLRLRRR